MNPAFWELVSQCAIRDAYVLCWELAEAHWSFVDRYADAMIARGPTLADDDGESMTGSMHLVNLPDAAAAQEFAFEEPYCKAGVFEAVLIRRWGNMLGGTMWDFCGSGGRRFPIIGHGAPEPSVRRAGLRGQQLDYLAACGYRDGIIACWPLLSDSGTEWLGTAMLVELEGRTAAEAMMAHGPYARADLYEESRFTTGGSAGGRTNRPGSGDWPGVPDAPGASCSTPPSWMRSRWPPPW
jgi:hypothetical protein